MGNFFCGAERNEIHVFNLFAVVGDNTISSSAAKIGVQQSIRDLIFLGVRGETNNTYFLGGKNVKSQTANTNGHLQSVTNPRINHSHLCPGSTDFLNIIPDYLRGDSSTYLDVVRQILQTQFKMFLMYQLMCVNDTFRMF